MTFDLGEMAQEICHQAKGHDLVGILYGGEQSIGWGSSDGSLLWRDFHDWRFDYSVHGLGDQAVKNELAGQQWDIDQFAQQWGSDLAEFALIKQPKKQLKPDHYRVYLAPAAVADLVNFCDFSAGNFHRKQSFLQKFHEHKASLSSAVSLTQDHRLAISAGFNHQGYPAPETIDLVTQGKPQSLLVSPASAKEYQLTHNGANDWEYAESLSMSSGSLACEDILEQLGDGIYINQLHYTNASDPLNAGVTGMTRFACYQVKNGQKVAPIEVMRFDDSLYRLLGSQLEALTQKRQLQLAAYTYGQRARGGALVPGALIKQMAFKS